MKDNGRIFVTFLFSIFIFFISSLFLFNDVVLAEGLPSSISNTSTYTVQVTPATNTTNVPSTCQTETINIQSQPFKSANRSNIGSLLGQSSTGIITCPTGTQLCCEGNSSPPSCICCKVLQPTLTSPLSPTNPANIP